MKQNLIYVAVLAFAVTIMSGNVSAQKSTMKDSRDGKTYKTIKIGDQTWMAENLAYKKKGSKAYDKNNGNIKKYGLLYTYSAANGACPSGWTLPTKNDFKK